MIEAIDSSLLKPITQEVFNALEKLGADVIDKANNL